MARKSKGPTVKELRKIASQRKIKGRSKLRTKAQLLGALGMNAEGPSKRAGRRRVDADKIRSGRSPQVRDTGASKGDIGIAGKKARVTSDRALKRIRKVKRDVEISRKKHAKFRDETDQAIGRAEDFLRGLKGKPTRRKALDNLLGKKSPDLKGKVVPFKRPKKNHSLKDLRRMATEKGIKGRSKLKSKADLEEALGINQKKRSSKDRAIDLEASGKAVRQSAQRAGRAVGKSSKQVDKEIDNIKKRVARKKRRKRRRRDG